MVFTVCNCYLQRLNKKEIPTSWKRKEFKDFDYISIELTETQFYVTLFIIIAYVIISSIIFIKNDYKNENV